MVNLIGTIIFFGTIANFFVGFIPFTYHWGFDVAAFVIGFFMMTHSEDSKWTTLE